MKKAILSMIVMLFSISAMAVTSFYGNLECLKGQTVISVSLDLSKTIYNAQYTVEDFLNKAPRSKEWKEGSIHQFVSEFNEKTQKTGILAIENSDTEYEMQIVPGELTTRGAFKKVVVNVINKKSGELMCCMSLDTDDGDKDDVIAFRDTMGEMGEQLGKYFAMKIKKMK